MRRFRVPGLIIGTAVGMATWSPAVEAQQGSLAVQMGQAVDEAGNAHAALTVSPTLRWIGESAAVAVGGQITALGSASFLGAVSGSSRVQAMAAGPVSLVVGAEAVGVGSEAGYRAGAAVLTPVARLAVRRVGLEVGPYIGTGASRLGTRIHRGGGLAGLLDSRGTSTGETHYRSEIGWTAEGWAEHGPAWVRVGRRESSSGERSWEEWNVESGVAVQPFTVRVRSGARQGSLNELSFAAGLTVQVSERMAVGVEGGRTLSSTLLSQPGGTYGTVGASWSIGGAQ